jgi:hypothetical protein
MIVCDCETGKGWGAIVPKELSALLNASVDSVACAVLLRSRTTDSTESPPIADLWSHQVAPSQTASNQFARHAAARKAGSSRGVLTRLAYQRLSCPVAPSRTQSNLPGHSRPSRTGNFFPFDLGCGALQFGLCRMETILLWSRITTPPAARILPAIVKSTI